MKKYTHAWLAFMAIKRLEGTELSDGNRTIADNLINWFKNHKDEVLQGAWYPDEVIKDMASSHVYKITPSDSNTYVFRKLPSSHLTYEYGKQSSLWNKSFTHDEDTNLPYRCEALAHSVIDLLKMQVSEEKGSPVSPINNQIAMIFFMLSHYIADAHMPFHCDGRRFSIGPDLHGHIEGIWDDLVREFFQIDLRNERFFYDPDGYPLRTEGNDHEFQESLLGTVEERLKNRNFYITWGSGNNNTLDFMSAVCQYSYLMSYSFIPREYDHTNITLDNLDSVVEMSFAKLSVAALSDAIDSIARVWFRVWRRYLDWYNSQIMY